MKLQARCTLPGVVARPRESLGLQPVARVLVLLTAVTAQTSPGCVLCGLCFGTFYGVFMSPVDLGGGLLLVQKIMH